VKWRARWALIRAMFWAGVRLRRVTTLRYAGHLLYVAVDLPFGPKVFWHHPGFPHDHIAWQLLRMIR
jgi:hypothetical protein